MLESILIPEQPSFQEKIFSENYSLSSSFLSKISHFVDDPDRPLFIINLDDVSEKYKLWTTLLPRVIPYYAVKSNPDIEICQELAKLGCNFDCASAGEIQLIQSIGVSTDRIIYANPMKHPSHLTYAKDNGVNFTVFDSKEELYKLQEIHPYSKLLLRIHVDDSFAICPLNGKFGARQKDLLPLLNLSKELGLNVVGISFHVGSGCTSTEAYDKALNYARSVFDLAEQLGFNFDVLDIGGGFPGTWGQETVSFPAIASVVAPLLDRLFPPSVTVIAEPGRYFCCSCSTLVTRVIGKREVLVDDELTFYYYLNDGLYGSFNCIIYDHVNPIPYPVKDVSGCSLYKTTMFGPTCDSLDKIVSDYTFPQMCVGDLIYFPNMGAYTKCAASQFNGFLLPKVHYVRFSHMDN